MWRCVQLTLEHRDSLCTKKVDSTAIRCVYIEEERGREKQAKVNQMQTVLWKLWPAKTLSPTFIHTCRMLCITLGVTVILHSTGSLTRTDGSCCLLSSPCVRNTRYWLGGCLTKQKLLIELMHLRTCCDRSRRLASKCLASRQRGKEETH